MGFGAIRKRLQARDFHPQLRWHARLLPRTAVTPFTVWLFRRVPVGAPDHAQTTVAALPSGTTVHIHRPRVVHGGAGAAVLWIHGGGFVLGSAAMDDRLCRRYADALGVVVVAVDYRLAPEHPYPAALRDCYEALVWLTRQSEFDPARLAVVGASAGGGLAAALALMVRDRAELALAAQVLVYPMLDDRSSRERDPDPQVRRMWSAASSRLGWSAYLAGVDPALAVPARQQNLGGLAPAWIGVGDQDILCDEARDYARRLSEDAVPCELVLVAGAFHGFDAVAPKTVLAQAFFQSQCDMLRRCLETDHPQSCT